MNIKKKGFTIVELVIVIAVVAILAAVLIPTFASLVKKANMSADQQAVRQMNTILSAENVENEIESVEEVRAILLKNGFNVESYTPMAEGTRFYWVQSIKRVIYVNEEDKTVIYPLGLETGSSDLWEPLDVEVELLTLDQQAINQMNIILANDEINNEILEISDVFILLLENGFDIVDYKPLTAGTSFYWIESLNRIIQADTNTHEILYPTNLNNVPNFESGEWKLLQREIPNDLDRIYPDDAPMAIIEKIDNPKDEWSNGDFYIFKTSDDLYNENINEEQRRKYENWIADFAIILNDDFDKYTCGIAGKYKFGNHEFDWISVEPDIDLSKGQVILLMKDVLGMENLVTYSLLLQGCMTTNGIREGFKCGAYSLDSNNSGSSIVVQLRLYETIKDEETNSYKKTGKYIVVSEIPCTFE